MTLKYFDVIQKPYIFLIAGVIFTLLFINSTYPENKKNGVGDVVFSVLKPGDFKKEHEGEWVLLYGGNFHDSELADIYGIENIPDARGRFIRIIDTIGGRDKGRKLKTQKIGDHQGEAVKIPELNTDVSGTHRHNMGYGVRSDQGFNNQNEAKGGLGQAAGARTDAWFYHTSTGGSEHSHKTKPVGNETRPENIILYAYIKIN